MNSFEFRYTPIRNILHSISPSSPLCIPLRRGNPTIPPTLLLPCLKHRRHPIRKPSRRRSRSSSRSFPSILRVPEHEPKREKTPTTIVSLLAGHKWRQRGNHGRMESPLAFLAPQAAILVDPRVLKQNVAVRTRRPEALQPLPLISLMILLRRPTAMVDGDIVCC